ncbi:hypothetical protein IT6_02590 [Methylacidiphilum caldifontis]|uniref:hypothetical protein n=1 Tax=Methylacidiphilum caldifontis TaxID=2795386 RepID=UPI001A8FCC47|nr:hypothetical protein [Methylacidiphilum caldifontis]QSR89192.1 hypothetical protein IT6_02590 [Methylacidiphilum caldifontis]
MAKWQFAGWITFVVRLQRRAPTRFDSGKQHVIIHNATYLLVNFRIGFIEEISPLPWLGTFTPHGNYFFFDCAAAQTS